MDGRRSSQEKRSPLEQRSLLERFLSIFAPVRSGEGGSVLLLTLNVFLLLTAYYIIKPVREALILSEWGADAKIYTSAGQAVLLLVVVPLYSRLAGAVDRRRLISYVLFFFMGCLGVFYLLARAGVPLGIPFYLWVGIFNVMVIAQFWSFANDVYTSEQGKRLFAIVGFGASSGAVLGGLITGRLIESVGVFQLLPLSAGLLGGALLLTWIVDRGAARKTGREAGGTAESTESVEAQARAGGRGGFGLVLANRYLLLIAGMMVLANLVNTTGEYILSSRVKAAAEAAVPAIEAGLQGAAADAAEAQRQALVGVRMGKFYSSFFNVVNLVGLLMQLFLVSRIVRWVGVRWAILFLPTVAFGGYLLMGLFPAEHRAQHAFSAHHARREVPGQAGHRQFLLARGGYAGRVAGVAGDHRPASVHAGICVGEWRAGGGVDSGCLGHRAQVSGFECGAFRLPSCRLKLSRLAWALLLPMPTCLFSV